MLANYRPPLQAEKRLTEGLAQQDQKIALGLLAGAATLMVLPILLRGFLPAPIKSALLLGAVAASGALTAVAAQSSTQERQRQYQVFDRIHQETLKTQLAHEVNQHQIMSELAARMRLAMIVQQLPPQSRQAVAAQYGLMQFVTFPELEAMREAGQAVAVKPAIADRGSVTGYEYTPPLEAEPTEDWIADLVAKFAEPDPEKRIYAHLIVNGPTRSGKSTLVSKLLELIGQAIAAHGQAAQIMLIDPKYPKTKWPLKPAFTGFAMVQTGLQEAVRIFRDRKLQCIVAEEAGQPHPEFPRLIVVVDEQDSIYNEGRGHPELGDDREERKAAVEEIHSIEVNLLKEAAAYDVSLFIVGQSPLSGATGFSRSDMQQACRIVLGNEALKWLNDKEFPFKEDVPELADDLKYWMDRGDRCALICPNMGRPYTAGIPPLTIGPVVVDERPQSVPDVPTPRPSDNAALAPLLAELNDWIESLGRLPTDEELIGKFKLLTGKDLNDRGLQLLKEELGL